MKLTTTSRSRLAARIREVRVEKFGDGPDGIADLSDVLGLPPQTWANFETGVSMPTEVVLTLITLTGVNAEWLLTGNGEQYSMPDPDPTLGFEYWR